MKILFLVMPNLAHGAVALRKLNMHDAQNVYDYSSDPLVAKHVLWDAHRNVAESKSYIRYMMRKYRLGEPEQLGRQNT